jgi:hypothetical protein
MDRAVWVGAHHRISDVRKEAGSRPDACLSVRVDSVGKGEFQVSKTEYLQTLELIRTSADAFMKDGNTSHLEVIAASWDSLRAAGMDQLADVDLNADIIADITEALRSLERSSQR